MDSQAAEEDAADPGRGLFRNKISDMLGERRWATRPHPRHHRRRNRRLKFSLAHWTGTDGPGLCRGNLQSHPTVRTGYRYARCWNTRPRRSCHRLSSFRIGSAPSPLSITKPATFCGIDLLVLLELPKWGQTGADPSAVLERDPGHMERAPVGPRHLCFSKRSSWKNCDCHNGGVSVVCLSRRSFVN